MTTAKDTSRWEGKAVRTKPAKIEAFAYEGNVRVAVVRCCYCSKLHNHVVPEDVMQDAPLIRTARCKTGGSQDYRLVRPEDWVEPKESKRPRKYERASLDGQDIGGLVVISDGPDRISEQSGKGRRIRQLWAKCPCGNVALIPASSVPKGVASCGCKRGRPTDRTAEYEAWTRQK